MNHWLGLLVVNFVLCLICFISYSSQIFVIWPWYGRALSVELISLLLPFNILVFMLLWNYFLVVTTDPGRVPAGWQPNTTEDGFEVKKLTGAPRYCRMCKGFKPPRTHHCRTCDRCVLRMDHHCPWVNNCVGHFNYGHFIRFLFFVDVACAYHLVMVTSRVYESIHHRYWDFLSGMELTFIILNYVACVPVMLAVGGFSIYHFLGILGNTTTIEGWEKDKAATLVRRGRIREVKFPYNLGRRKNVESVLGPNPLWWCWPSVTPGTGLTFELAETDGSDDEGQAWPPTDPKKDDSNGFALPESPWTYDANSLNPDLQPSNSQRRQTQLAQRRGKARTSRQPGASTLPPYHPDYREDGENSDSYSISSDEEYQGHVRSGSEGPEARPIANREDLLRKYLEDLGETPGRYHRYISHPVDSDSEEENRPLAGVTS